jgi:hypothetical protein
MHPVLSLTENCPFCGAMSTLSCEACGAPQIRLPSALTPDGWVYACQPCAFTRFINEQK